MIASIAQAQGYRTGLFTSPHLVTFRERIQVNGEMISEEEVAAGLTSIRQLVAGWEPHPTFFEIATGLGLVHFRNHDCELVVLETGMGGRLDATNAITPVVSVITPIDYDHQKWLGNTLAEIAAEKAGIIKPGVPVVAAPQRDEPERVVRQAAIDRAAQLSFVSRAAQLPPIGLAGKHQKENAALAVAALNAAHVSLTADAIADGLANVKWPARFQRWSERITIDGAHNPAGARVLAETWRAEFSDRRANTILAVLADKDAAGLSAALAPIATRFVLPQARSERALPPADLAAVVRATAPHMPVSVVSDLAEALRDLDEDAAPILITGSLHFAGEALAFLGGKPDALEDCFQ
jgi:dihydrofolate synthase/folylpolyglutamate synthase